MIPTSDPKEQFSAYVREFKVINNIDFIVLIFLFVQIKVEKLWSEISEGLPWTETKLN